jgi:hypothetical protein
MRNIFPLKGKAFRKPIFATFSKRFLKICKKIVITLLKPVITIAFFDYLRC